MNVSKDTPYVMTKEEIAVGIFRAFISPAIAIFGLIGNVMAFAVFLKQFLKSSKRNRFQVYVMFLAISDSVILIFNSFLDDFLGRGLLYLTNSQTVIKIDTYSDMTCKMMEYISPTFIFVSGYLLVAFSVDRVLTVLLPVKFQCVRWIKSCVAVCVGITFSGLVLSSPLAVSYGVIEPTVVTALSSKFTYLVHIYVHTYGKYLVME